MTGSTRAAAGWAAAVPLLCAAHCVATPLLVLVAPALALPEAGEAAVKAASALLAAGLAWRGVRVHRRAAVWLPVLAGAAVWGAAVALGSHDGAGRLWSALGGVLLAGGMGWNAQLRHRATCHSCGCGAHAAPQRRQLTDTAMAGEV